MTSSVIFVMCAIDHKSPVPHSVREPAEGSLVARATVVVDKVAMLCLNPSWKTLYHWCQKPKQLEKRWKKKLMDSKVNNEKNQSFVSLWE